MFQNHSNLRFSWNVLTREIKLRQSFESRLLNFFSRWHVFLLETCQLKIGKKVRLGSFSCKSVIVLDSSLSYYLQAHGVDRTKGTSVSPVMPWSKPRSQSFVTKVPAEFLTPSSSLLWNTYKPHPPHSSSNCQTQSQLFVFFVDYDSDPPTSYF